MSKSLSRRSFLQGTAAMVALPIISGCARDASALEKMANLKPGSKFVYTGTVNTAAHWGGMKVTLEKGKIVKSENVFDNYSFNSLQTTVGDMVYAEDRIKYPMVRKSYLKDPNNSKVELRGKEEWVRVSWDEAIKLVADQMKSTRATLGPSGIYAGSLGWRSAGNLHNSRNLIHRFHNVCGGFVGYKGDYSTAASQVIMPYVVGSIEVYEQQTSWEVVLESSEIVVIWGANPMTTLKLSSGATDNEGLEYMKRLRDGGKKVIVIDPIYTETSEFLKRSDWVAPKPNTDTAMMIGMCHALYSAKKHDQAFLDEYTEGFDKFKEYMLGTTDGVAKTPQWASEICGLPASKITELALLFAANRTMLMSGWAIQRQHRGEQRHWALVTLASMLGQIGLPGGGFGLSYHYANGGTPSANGGKIGGISPTSNWKKSSGKMDKAPNINIPVARIADLLLNPGKTIDYNGTKITYPKIETIHWIGGNPFSHHQDTNNLVRAWSKAKNIFVNEYFWTPTARMADVVLPATTSYEKNDITMGGDYSKKTILPMKAVVAPQFEAKSDYEIFTLLAREFGLEDYFTEQKSEMDWLSEFYEIARKGSKAKGVVIPAFRKFWADNQPIIYPTTQEAKKWVRYADYREDPLLNPLGTPSGKIEIYSEKVASMGYDDCKGHASWMEPIEWLGMENKPAPLALLSPHPSERLHSQQDNTPLRHTYEVQGREPIWINTQDANERGIKDGDAVRVFNKRGQVLAGAVVTEHILAGVVRLQEGAWYDPAEPGNEDTICRHGNVNCLTIDIPTSKLGVGNSANTALVDVEKYTGELPELTIFKQPKMA